MWPVVAGLALIAAGIALVPTGIALASGDVLSLVAVAVPGGPGWPGASAPRSGSWRRRWEPNTSASPQNANDSCPASGEGTPGSPPGQSERPVMPLVVRSGGLIEIKVSRVSWAVMACVTHSP